VWYSQTEGWTDATVGGPYRADCSGLVSMAWGLPSSYVTGTLPQVSHELTHNGGQADYSQLQPGDALISSGHAVLFAYWADSGHTVAAVYEEHHDGVRTTGPATDQQSISGLSSGGFLPYRYNKATGGTGSVTLPAWPNVVEGQTGSNVLAAQYLLIAHGATIGADGQFGTATTTAVEAFQRANGLGVDGQVGPQTWAELIVQIQTGSQGDAVEAAQTELNRYGYNLSVDGDFGSGTNSAAVSFQTAHGLGVDGQIGPQTWQALVGGTP
jgi:peptidoglycan hydrolase-like protein with peptidoglycan-binding domain